ncbi:MAG: 30S ribosomal protein S5 [Bacteroidia bacterium]|jgi:small subunit ribosomal protein S5|nr:30S ribosomal protein S5 [Bacteroidia bacterium]MDA8629810.1 30S ribosomal protein S5 [Bacteroidia bacterium]MDB2588694.1 30S ribosomal protein S5 [Bacteroidia bacterium]MDG1747669.1 30S ribosomal protein S5 [Bacteroidia bacterium]MEC8692299.1 30S ribosomal protein S5 [Bacteroidota bacterium]
MSNLNNNQRIRPGDITLTEKVVNINRVAKVTKGGRTFSFTALVVVGDGNGTVGHGLGKSGEVIEAINKGIEDAKKNLIKVNVINGTVPHEQLGKYGGGRVLLRPASSGTGVIAGGAMRAVLESAGVTDVLAKSKGSSNPHNVVKATFKALTSMRDAISVAQLRGISVKQVFNG